MPRCHDSKRTITHALYNNRFRMREPIIVNRYDMTDTSRLRGLSYDLCLRILSFTYIDATVESSIVYVIWKIVSVLCWHVYTLPNAGELRRLKLEIGRFVIVNFQFNVIVFV